MNKEKFLLIVNDLLSELQEGKSAKPEGVGITTNEYVETQLMSLRDLLKGYDCNNNLEILKKRRNKLNREIASLKKATLKA